MNEIEELRVVIAAQSKLLAEILGMTREDEGLLLLTNDEGYEYLDHCLGDLPADVRRRYFAPLDRMFPRHSSESD